MASFYRLAEHGAVFFSVKESYQSRVLKRKREKLEKEIAEQMQKEKEGQKKEGEDGDKTGDDDDGEGVWNKKQRIAEIGAKTAKRGGRRLGI